MVIRVDKLYYENARASELPQYLQKVDKLIQPHTAEVTLTGRAPAWMYLAVAVHIVKNHKHVKIVKYKGPKTEIKWEV